MSGSPANQSSGNPNSPQISPAVLFAEKANFAGAVLSAIFYGIAIVLFFQCLGALLNPVNRSRGGVRWGLVVHTIAMFSALTLNNATSLDLYPISYIDNRDFSGTPFSGPYGYQWLLYAKAIGIIPSVMFVLNTCLADGFLIYRCYVIYSKDYRVIVLPCLMYLTSLALGIMLTYYQALKLSPGAWNTIVGRFEVPYYLITLSLNVFLTFMIAARLVRHGRKIRNAIDTSRGHGFYKTVVTMLVESCVLYAVASILNIGPVSAESDVQGIFAQLFVNVQVIAPFLILQRVANRTALTSDVIASGKFHRIYFKKGELTSSNGTTSDGNFTSATETNGEVPIELRPRM